MYVSGIGSSDEATANRIRDRRGPRADIEPGQDVDDMSRHRSQADEERVGDLAIGEPIGEEVQHLALPLGGSGQRHQAHIRPVEQRTDLGDVPLAADE